MSWRELEEERQRLSALSAAQRLQLQADLGSVTEAVRLSLRPARLLGVALAVAAGVALTRRLVRHRSPRGAPPRQLTAAAVGLPLLAALMPWLPRARLAVRLWRSVSPYLPRRRQPLALSAKVAGAGS